MEQHLYIWQVSEVFLNINVGIFYNLNMQKCGQCEHINSNVFCCISVVAVFNYSIYFHFKCSLISIL